MMQSRLSFAVDQGGLVMPQGHVSVIRPPAGYELADLPPERVSIVHGFYPDAAWWKAAGYGVTQTVAQSGAVIVVVPRSKSLARGLIAQAARLAPLVIVDGNKTDGVDGLFRDIRARRGDVPSVTKAHGRVFWFHGGDDFADWSLGKPAQMDDGFYTQAGVFSNGGIDRGSALLASALPAKLSGRIADLGAGIGVLARQALTFDAVRSVDLIEAEALALDCAKLNVTDPRALFHWADARDFKPATAYDAVISNPPFHASRAAEPAIGQAFIAAAARMLAPHGQLWLVANRHLPYETELRTRFRNVEEVEGAGDSAFKIFHATRPNRQTNRQTNLQTNR